MCQGNKGMYNFISCYFDNLLTYGEAVAEIVLTSDGKILEHCTTLTPEM